MWYDVNKTLSYNCLFNFVVGARGVGKTYALKRRAIKNWIKKGEQFVYLRRYDTELIPSNMEKFFDDICVEFPDHEFYVKSGKFYIDEMIAGFYLPLSKAAQYKSVPFPNVSLVIFDEFIIDRGLVRYLPNEVVTFLEMYSTISRLRDVPVMFLSNAISFTNPYFLFFDLQLQPGQTILRKGDILLELVVDAEFADKAATTRFGRLVSGTAYYNYSVNNKFLLDNDTFVEKMEESGIYLFTLKCPELECGVYAVRSNKFWYVTERVDKTSPKVVSLDLASHDDSTAYAKSGRARVWLATLKEKYYKAEIRFASVKIKNVISDYLKRSV